MSNLIHQRSLIAAFLFPIIFPMFGAAQPALHFKTRDVDTRGSGPVTEIESPQPSGRGHLLLQFETRPSAAIVAELKRRGVDVLQDVPENGLLVSLSRRVDIEGLGARFSAAIDPHDKISPLAASGVNDGFFLVEFHPDVDMSHARALLASLGVTLREHPDLNPNHLMIPANDSYTLEAIAALDEVAYIFPASRALISGAPTGGCVGALTANGPTAQSIPTYGPGWAGPGHGAATIGYVFSKMTEQLDASAAQSTIERAMSEWAKAVEVSWQQGTDATAPQTVNILWGTYSHGDAFPFDGPGGVLAHTFYPVPVDPEPIAGDMHFDDSEIWRIGANTDLFSVALHELGHSLGLGHTDDPTAVMYPYYQMVSGLSALDISTVQTLYAAQTGSPSSSPTPTTNPPITNPPATNPPATNPPITTTPPAPAPLALTMNATASSTTATTVNLTGAVTGGQAGVSVTWSTNQAQSGTASVNGTAWSIVNLPLAVGSNTITVTAAAGTTRVSQTAAVTRTASAPPPTTPTTTTTTTTTTGAGSTTPPSLTISTPSSTSVSTLAATLVFSGTAADNTGVTLITWTTNTGGSGTASGTTQWSATIPLLVGSNTVTVSARDAAGNIGWRSVVVSRQ